MRWSGSHEAQATGRSERLRRAVAPARRGPGRPAEMTPEALLERIRELARGRDGLFLVHRRHAALYSRARRQFGSWRAAVLAAGLDHQKTLLAARRRALWTRRARRIREGGRS